MSAVAVTTRSAALPYAPVATLTLVPGYTPARAPGPYARPRRVLGDPTPLACTIVKTAVEVILGGSGLDQLNRWVTPEIRASLARQGALAQRAGRSLTEPVRILRIRVYRVTDTAAEASVIADDGWRVRAIAARFEDVGGRWQATVLDIG